MVHNGRYSTPTAATLNTLADLNRGGRPNLLFAGLAITPEAAQLGYLLSRLHDPRTNHFLLLKNSPEEAISAAVRIARHSGNINAKHGNSVLIVGAPPALKTYFNPLDEPIDTALVPGIRFEPSVRTAAELLSSEAFSAVLSVLGEGADNMSLRTLNEVARARGLLSGVYDTRPLAATLSDTGFGAAATAADMYIYGEHLVDDQVPFGCLLMTPHAYRVWDNPLDGMSQGSTFSSSTGVLTIAIDTLRRRELLRHQDEAVLRQIGADRKVRNEYFGRYVNPHAVTLLESFGLDFEFRHAAGMTMELSDGRSLCDCTGGMGSNLRGHNPPDNVRDVFTDHDESVDYSTQLADTLHKLSGFPEMFPAVSGTTAVENALALARLARPLRPKIVSFTGNFSGRSLAPISVSRYGPPLPSSIPDAFAPYCPGVVFVDPFSTDAAKQLTHALSDPSVGLVWCELIQGSSCLPIPQHLLKIIEDLKPAGGYLIGVDEILTGAWRAGEEFLYHARNLPSADLVAISKPLSDMTIPMAAALTTRQVVDAARRTDSAAVDQLQAQYRNNLGAHIATHALAKVDTPGAHAERRKARQILAEGLEQLVKKSSLYEGVTGSGAQLRLIPSRKYFPFKSGSFAAEMTESSFENLVLQRCGVILSRGRFLFPIFPQAHDLEETMRRMQRLADVSPITVYRGTAVNVVKLFVHMGLQRLRRSRG